MTSAFHMYRVKRLFKNQVFQVISCKIDYSVGRSLKIKIMDFLPDAEN